jgi:hypothetical protein
MRKEHTQARGWSRVAIVTSPDDCVLCCQLLPAVNIFDIQATPFDLCRVHSLRVLFTLEQHQWTAKRTFEGEEEVIIRDGSSSSKQAKA